MLRRFDHPGFRQITMMPGPSSNLEDCDLSISVLGHMKSLTGFDWSQVSARTCIHFVTKGSGILIHNKQQYALKAGDAFCFFKDEEYSYFDHKEDLWEYTWITLHGSQANAMCQSLGFDRDKPRCQNLSTKPIKNLISEIDGAYSREDHSLYFPQAVAWRLFDILHARNVSVAPMDQLAFVLRRILDEDYFQVEMSINQIAEDLHVNRSTLFRHFQRVYGMAPKVYLEQQRMRHAKALLRGQHLSIKKVAEQCGYEDPQYFSRVFRKHEGIAPSDYA